MRCVRCLRVIPNNKIRPLTAGDVFQIFQDLETKHFHYRLSPHIDYEDEVEEKVAFVDAMKSLGFLPEFEGKISPSHWHRYRQSPKIRRPYIRVNDPFRAVEMGDTRR